MQKAFRPEASRVQGGKVLVRARSLATKVAQDDSWSIAMLIGRLCPGPGNYHLPLKSG